MRPESYARITATHSDRFGKTINRAHSPFLVHGIPLATIIVASLSPLLPVISSGPLIPPLGFMVLIAWRIVRPGLLPLWIGIPLGAVDDLFSGNPFGTAIMLWSLALIALEAIETRFPWRGFLQDWATASALITAFIILSAFIAGGGFGPSQLHLILPQLLLSLLLFPIIARMAAFFDRVRLRRIRVVR